MLFLNVLFTIFLNFWTIVHLFWNNKFTKLMIFLKSTTKWLFRFNLRLHKFKISLCSEQWAVPHAIPVSLQEEPDDRADRCLSYPGLCRCFCLSLPFAMMRRRNLQRLECCHFQDWSFHPHPQCHHPHHLHTLRTVCKAAGKKE